MQELGSCRIRDRVGFGIVQELGSCRIRDHIGNCVLSKNNSNIGALVLSCVEDTISTATPRRETLRSKAYNNKFECSEYHCMFQYLLGFTVL